MKKRTISLLLIAALVVSMFSVTVFADEYDITADPEITEGTGELQIDSEDATEPETDAEILDDSLSMIVDLPDAVKDIVDKISSFCSGLTKDGLKDTADELFGKLTEFLSNAVDKVELPQLPDLSKLRDALEQLPADLSGFTKESVQAVSEAVKNALQKLQSADIVDVDVEKMAKDIKEAISKLVKNEDTNVKSVKLNKSIATLNVGETMQLKATVKPNSALDKSVTWKSSNSKVVAVSSDGLIKGKSIGSATITVTTNDGNKTATCTVFVFRPLSELSVTLSKTRVAYTGKALKPTVTVKDGSKTLKQDEDYTVNYFNNTNVGTATVSVIGKGFYTGMVLEYFKIAKAANPLTLNKYKYTYKQAVLTSPIIIKIGVTKAAGEVTFRRDDKAKAAKIKLNEKGEVTIPKKCAKGTYTIKVKAAGDSNHKAGSKQVVIVIK